MFIQVNHMDAPAGSFKSFVDYDADGPFPGIINTLGVKVYGTEVSSKPLSIAM